MPATLLRSRVFRTTVLLLAGVGVTAGAVALVVRSRSDLWALPVLPVLGLVLVGGTRVLPDAWTVPYDPVGHPVLWAVGLVANSVYVAGAVHALTRAVRCMAARNRNSQIGRASGRERG